MSSKNRKSGEARSSFENSAIEPLEGRVVLASAVAATLAELAPVDAGRAINSGSTANLTAGESATPDSAELEPYTPQFWSSPMVLSTITNTNSDAAEYPTGSTIYV